MITLPKNKEGRTIKEGVGNEASLRSSMQAQKENTFTFSRGNDIARPYNAGNDWGRLASALGTFDKSLSSYLTNELDRQIEEGVSLGNEAYSSPNNVGADGLRMDFKSWSEANPEMAGRNPYIIKGYEQSRLRNIGMEYQKELGDFYATSGLRNEADPQKLEASVNAFAKQWYEQRGLSQYEDKLMLAGNFSPQVAKGKASILAQHSSNLSEQNLVRIKTSFQQEMAGYLEQIGDPRQGGFNISNPNSRTQATVAFGARVSTLAQELAANGYPDAHIPSVIVEMLDSQANKAAEEGDEDMLDLVESMLGLEINGVQLSKLPNVAANISKYQESLSDREWKQFTRAKQMQAYHREDEARQTIAYSYGLGMGREDISMGRIAADNPAWTPEQQLAAYNSANQLRSASFTDPQVNPNTAASLFTDRQRVINGSLGPEDVHELVSKYGSHATSMVQDLLAENKDFVKSHHTTLRTIGLNVVSFTNAEVQRNPERYDEIFETRQSEKFFTLQEQNTIAEAQAKFTVWMEALQKENKIPSTAEITLKEQEIINEYKVKHMERRSKEEMVKRVDEASKMSEKAHKNSDAQAQKERRVGMMAMRANTDFLAPLSLEARQALAPLIQEAGIPMPETQKALINFLHTYYPNISEQDFEQLNIIRKTEDLNLNLYP